MTIMFYIIYSAFICLQNGFELWYANIKNLSYFLLLPLLISAFVIDWRKQIIPNRLVLTILK